MRELGYISAIIVLIIFYLVFIKIGTIILRTRKLLDNIASEDPNNKNLFDLLKTFPGLLIIAICILIGFNVFIYNVSGLYGVIVSSIIFIFLSMREIKMQKFINKNGSIFTDIINNSIKTDESQSIKVINVQAQDDVTRRGIRFLIPNEWSKVLNDILEGIDCSKYTWITGNQEVHVEDNKFLFESEIINGDIMYNLIKEKKYYPVFLDLEAFPKGEEVHKINTYEEFEQSKCALIIMIADSVYVDIYVKNEELLIIISNNAIKNNYEGIEYINSNNDNRNIIC
ncbi:MAG: DUF2691 family protein [Clostridia bacterium]|nr:DUF2691 family protein [Clostridia bacterium]MDD4386237.1 DUF2691 family protein [Clostridia bacterium]